MKKRHALIISSALFGLYAVPAHAAITYVEALHGSGGNTFATGGAQNDVSWVDLVSNTSSSVQDVWVLRSGTDFGNSDNVYQAIHTVTGQTGDVDGDNMPQLTTTIGGLANGTYSIWAFYWDQVVNTSQNWTISTGLTSGSLTSYSSTVNDPGVPAVTGATASGVDTASLAFTTTILKIANEGNATQERRLYGVNLGEVTVSGGAGTVNVFVDNLIGNGSGNRTWYDGVGFELVPEPSSAVLGCLGALILLRRRRA